jgi:membrane-bound metal-dependent hydrolase YbcI (DUF457 family)
MDPVLHLALPLLFLLALRVDTRTAVLLAPLAILPDFDAAFGLHRAAFHNFVFVILLPVALIAYSKLKRPAWLPWALVVQFYLASHVVLDLGGVAFMWPVVKDQIFFDPEITFNLQGGVNFGFDFEYGLRPYSPMGTTDFLSEAGFALIFLAVLVAAVFRKEALVSFRKLWTIVKGVFVR